MDYKVLTGLYTYSTLLSNARIYGGILRKFYYKNPAKVMSFAGEYDPVRAFARTFVPYSRMKRQRKRWAKCVYHNFSPITDSSDVRAGFTTPLWSGA